MIIANKINYSIVLVIKYAKEVFNDIYQQIFFFLTSKNYCLKPYMEVSLIPEILDKYNNTKEELTDEEYWIIYNNENMHIPEKKHIITHICFDDLIGDRNTFKKSRDGGLVKFLLKHRHLYTNIFITTQYVNAIQPIIKNNIDILCIFKYMNY